MKKTFSICLMTVSFCLGLSADWQDDYAKGLESISNQNLTEAAYFLEKSIKDPDSPEYDENGNGFPDYREKSLFEGVFGSFGDAPNGFKEELRELMYSVGVEYWYNKQFAFRAGYYYEHATKGNRQFLTAGLGLKYNVFGLNISYLVPTSNQRSPLDNTLRFTLVFHLDERAPVESN